MTNKIITFLVALSMMVPCMNVVRASEAVEALNKEIKALPETLLDSENVVQTIKDVHAIQEAYAALSEGEQAEVTGYAKVETLADPCSETLGANKVAPQANSPLAGKTIGYLGSSITYGFRTNGVAFPEYIQQLTNSKAVKQAISGGPLANVPGVRDEISYITQLLDGAITPDHDLDVLVVQVSTNDAALGIEMGKLSDSYNLEDLDYSTIIGAMEYIAAYAKETWNCPVAFYTNPFLSDDAAESFCKANGIDDLDSVKVPYQQVYAEMIENVYKVMEKWNGTVIDMWNNEPFKSADVETREFYMGDVIHPTNAGYLFWYAPYIQAQLEKIVASYQPEVDLTKVNDTTFQYVSTNQINYSSTFQPQFYIYAGNVTEKKAEAIVESLGMKAEVEAWAGSINVVNPINGKTYTSEDATAFLTAIGGAICNVKVIGIDEGATFVNNELSQVAYPIAGIMTHGGTMNQTEKGAYVPVYLSNACKEAVDYFKSVNDANDPLQKVVVAKDATLAEAFDNAWKQVFSRNYRSMNEVTEFYMANAFTWTEPYILYAIPNFEELDMTFNAIYNEPVNGEGEYTWFEYVPNSTFAKPNGSVPLVVSLHGNGNDPRLQGDTTGWPELAAKEGFIVVAPEWQDVVMDSETHTPGPNFFGCDGLEGDKLIEWLEDVIEVKYPQIDTNRIYVSGLSAGGSASVLYGVKYHDTFAGVGAVSAPGVDKDELAEIVKTYEGGNVPMVYCAGDHDFFGMIPVDGSSTNSFEVAPGLHLQAVDPNCSIWSFIQSYYKVNGLEVPETWDMEANPYYGIKGDAKWTTIGAKDAYETVISNDNGAIMKFAAIKMQAHWNYKPEAEYMWNFLKDFSKDSQEITSVTLDDTTVYVYDASALTNEYKENQVNKQVYLIYPDTKLTKVEAARLLQELGIIDHLNEYATKAVIINPINDQYGKADIDTYLKALDIYGSMLNTKVIGIGNGATFVNQEVAQKDWALAGIMTYGGEVGFAPKYSVPAYVSNSAKVVAEQYARANKATQSTTNGTITTTVNPDNHFEIVVCNTEEETLAEAFANAWSTVFSKNARIGNIGGTFYTKKNSEERPFQYTSYVIAEELGIEINVVNNVDLDNDGINNLWYEYIPEQVKDAKEGTVPMVLLLHGNGNDARTQFETSGWAQVAAKNGIILVAPEWQGTPVWDPMTDNDSTSDNNDIITLVKAIEAKYPQIDTSRVYTEGLSRGSLNSINIGLSQTKTFAAIGCHSGGTFPEFVETLQAYVDQNKDELDLPFYFVAGTKDQFFPVTTNPGLVEAIKLVQELNNIENPISVDGLDLEIDPWWGFEMENYGKINITKEGLCDIYSGTFTNEKGVQICLNAIEDWAHWNYEPTAELMWNFFKQYSRNTTTGELIVEGQQTTPTTPDNGGTTGTTTPNVGIYNNTAYVAVATIALAGAAYVSMKKKKED